MKTVRTCSAIALGGMLILTVSAPAADTLPPPEADPVAPPSAPAQRSPAELEKLAAPIALYPDPLVATILPAAVYPIEIVQAARFVMDTNNLPKVKDQPWDENVKEVAKFPQVIKQMSDDLSWTVDLGQAFLDQPSELMTAIQALREKARTAGSLKTTPQQIVLVTNAVVERTYEQQIVYVTNTIVQITPANPQVIYVPTYNPTVVYAPPPPSGPPPVVTFGLGIAVGAIIANNCDWHYGGIYVGGSGVAVWGGGGRYPYYPPPPGYRPPPYYPPPGYRPPPPGYRPPGYPPPGYRPPAGYPTPRATTMQAGGATGQRWQPDAARLDRAGATPMPATSQARGWGSSSTRPTATTGTGSRPTTGGVGARPGQPPAAGTRPTTTTAGTKQPTIKQPTFQQPSVRQPSFQQPSVNRSASSPTAGTRPAASPSVSRSSSAFSGVNNGARANTYSSRGAASRGGGRARSGGGRR